MFMRSPTIHFSLACALLLGACSKEAGDARNNVETNASSSDAAGDANGSNASNGMANNAANAATNDAGTTNASANNGGVDAGGDAGTDMSTGPSCVTTNTCSDPRPTDCGNGVCNDGDHCGFCEEDCGACEQPAPTVTRGPYLQTAAPDSIVVKWRTETETDSVVAFGPAPDDLKWAVAVAGSTSRHEVSLTGLTPSTRYHYAVGSTDAALVGGDEEHYFVTSPPKGQSRPTRIWVIGDSGDAGSDQQAVRDAYLNYVGDRPADVWLMLGDNAYSDGTDSEHQEAVFDAAAYQGLVRNTVVWPTIGNHERVDEDGLASPYFEIWTLPVDGEAGGLASGTEYYYSYDYGDIHFVVLDSDTHDESQDAMSWLRSDLEANDKKWLIAYWHHPPYSNGSHNSDDGGTESDMRENFVPILEEFGVDMVFTGHSHSYERSMFLYGHYGESDTLEDSMIIGKANDGLASDGDPDGDGPYEKVDGADCPDIGTPLADGVACGTVYSVVGSSSKTSGSDYPNRYDGGVLMPMMITFQEKLGSVVIDIDGDRADVVFLNSGDDGDGTANYTITDEYTVSK